MIDLELGGWTSNSDGFRNAVLELGWQQIWKWDLLRCQTTIDLEIAY